MARLDKDVASEFDFYEISKMIPSSAIGSYNQLVREVDELTRSADPEVRDFRKKTIKGFNTAVRRCYELSLKGMCGKPEEREFWTWLNEYRENTESDPFVSKMLEDISSAISMNAGININYINSWRGFNQPGVSMTPRLDGEVYNGRFNSRWGDPLCYGLSEIESCELIEQMQSLTAQID